MGTVINRIWGPAGRRLLAGDLLVLSLLIAGVVGASLPPKGRRSPARAEILVSGAKVLTFDLSRDGVHDVLGPIGVTRLEVGGGKVRVLTSPCPQQVCRHTGWVDAPGSLIVCLPNEVVVRLPDEPGGTTAAISR